MRRDAVEDKDDFEMLDIKKKDEDEEEEKKEQVD